MTIGSTQVSWQLQPLQLYNSATETMAKMRPERPIQIVFHIMQHGQELQITHTFRHGDLDRTFPFNSRPRKRRRVCSHALNASSNRSQENALRTVAATAQEIIDMNSQNTSSARLHVCRKRDSQRPDRRRDRTPRESPCHTDKEDGKIQMHGSIFSGSQ